MKNKKDYLFEDFPEFKVTEETRKDIIENPQKYSGCDVRIRMVNLILMKNIKEKLKKDLAENCQVKRNYVKEELKENKKGVKTKIGNSL